MPTYQVLVLTEPTAGLEDAFNDHYETQHLDEVLATTGWAGAQRFRLAASAGEAAPLPYLAIYEAEADSAEAALARLNETRKDRHQSPALNRRTGRVWVFEAIGPKHGG